MRAIKVVLLIMTCFLHLTSMAQEKASKDIAQTPAFLIDTSKPYVYLEVDHVGARKPLRDGEPNSGIWLHLKNNCKLPIIVLAISEQLQNPDKSLVLQDEVVPNRHVVGEDARGGGVFAPRGLEAILENMRDIVRFPNMTEEEVKGAEAAAIASKVPPPRPAGYNFYNGFDKFELKLVAPGDQVLFSVPSSHVSKDWHIEIPFRLGIPNNSQISPPYSYLAFYQEDLGPSTRKAPMPTTR